MQAYNKIQTLFNRDPVTFKVRIPEFRCPEFAAIDAWFATEKVDGTNTRIHFEHDGETIGWKIGGRTDKAQIPMPLFDVLCDTADAVEAEVIKIMDEYKISSYTLFGEGYGPGIQKGGGNLSTQARFILFDVLVNDRTWLSPQAVTDASIRLGVDLVPCEPQALGIPEIVAWARQGVPSSVANKYGTPGTMAEGLVCQPIEPLYDSRGHRVMWKIKTKDFPAES